MGILQIRLFGRVQVSHDDWLTEIKMTRVVQGLLAYLLLQRHRTHSRDVLAALFWGEQSQERARGSLNTTIWRLRRLLEPDGTPPRTYLMGNHAGEVGFNPESHYWLDVATFEEQIKRILAFPYPSLDEGEIEKLKRALQLYKGELLEGFYDDWALRERERLRSLYLSSLAFLLRHEKYNGSYENALGYGRQILELDPLREEIHREMMRLYVENGQRALAVRQYETCRENLKTELKIEPMEETQALYAQILRSGVPTQNASQNDEQIGLVDSLQQLLQTAQSVEQVREQLWKAIGFIEALAEEGRKPN